MPNATPSRPHLTHSKRPRKELAALQQQREAWLEKLRPQSHFHRLFDYLPGVFFFAKDGQGRTMFASQGILQRYHMREESEMLGLTDFDLNPGSMAESYVLDDRRLLSGKVHLIERLELWFDRQGLPDWFFVAKLPLVDKAGRPHGIMGVLRRAEHHEKQLPLFQTVSRAVETMRRDYAKPLEIAEVAAKCGESVRQLQRRFQKAFGISPQEFLLKTRVLAATRLLEETNLTAAEIAQRSGFQDGSSLAEHFRRRTGCTPSTYRTEFRRHASKP